MTIPLDRQLVSTAVSTAILPVTTVRRIAKSQNGLPAYLAVGGLAVVGVLEWPVAAVAGAGLVALRRWGPLRPATSSAPEAVEASEASESPATEEPVAKTAASPKAAKAARAAKTSKAAKTS